LGGIGIRADRRRSNLTEVIPVRPLIDTCH